jgi:hypothetical protein
MIFLDQFHILIYKIDPDHLMNSSPLPFVTNGRPIKNLGIRSYGWWSWPTIDAHQKPFGASLPPFVTNGGTKESN